MMMISIRHVCFCLVLAAVSLFTVAVEPASAQNRLGGHFGVAIPLVTRAEGETTTVADDFVVVVPTGITVRKSDTFAFDLELAPIIQNEPRHIDLLVHPGVAWGIGHGYSVGGRLALVAGTATWGFTPLFNKGLVQLTHDTNLWAELDVPVRFNQDRRGRNFASVGLVVVSGLSF